MSEIVILGAGLTGLSAGYHAGRSGLDYHIYEQNGHVGGLCATRKKDGFYFDYAGHLLHLKSPYQREWVNRLLRNNLETRQRNAAILSHGALIPYPFQANLRSLPPRALKECLLGFVKAHYEGQDLPTNAYPSFRDWIIAKLGKGIGRHFMFPYNAKVWTVPPEEMTCEWLADFVPRPSLEEVFEGAFLPQRKAFGYNAEFLYPRAGGIQTLADALAAGVPRLTLNEKLVRLRLDQRLAEFESGREVPFRVLVSTLPLKSLVEKLDGRVPPDVIQAAKSLKHNSLLIVNVGIKGGDLTDKHWIYVPEKKYQAYRVGVYSNFSKRMAPPGMTSYYIEIAYQKKWRLNRSQAVDKAIADMVEMGLIPAKRDIVTREIMDIECAYVIYDRNYAGSRKLILDFLEKQGVHSIGRYGNWAYDDMDSALGQGKALIDRLNR